MANNSPTIVAASLSDDQLKKSIDSLVTHVDEAMKKMVQSTNNAVGEMEAKLKSLGNLKIDSNGTVDGGASKRAKSQNAETDAVEKNIAARDKQIKKNQEVSMSYDQMAAATQKATSGSKMSVIETYDMQIEMFKNRLREVRQDIDIFNAAIGSGKKTQIEWGQQGLKQANAEAEKLMRIITTLENQRGNLANVIAPQGHTIQNYVNSLQKANPELAQLNDSFKRGQSLMQNGITTTQQLANAQGELNTKTNQQKQTLDDMNAYIRQNIQREQERRAAIRQTGLAARESADQLIRSAHEQASAQGKNPITGAKELTEAVEKMRSAYFDMSASEKASPIGLALEADIKRANDAIAVIRKYNQSLLGSQQNDANKITNASTLNSLRESLKNLTEQYNKLTVAELNAGKGDALIQHFQDTTRAAQILQRTLNRPVNLKAALSGDERTLDDIAYKMQRLRSYRQGIDLTKPNATNEIKQVDEALARLQKDADKWMSKSQDLIKNNTALGRSWNYMKNRLAFYVTVGAGTSFIKQLIDIRSQYEMNEKALGILLDSASRGTRIFNELSQMSLVSPYTLIELSNAAKQLTAYDIAAKDVVDTTRRLADMASAVGVPVERLTYALGQIKAYGYLNSRDARMFANAGIPLVKQLADRYSELEGKMVSTADVYDRMKKKAIDYNDVMAVINKMTDEGGKFFDFQAKMAETLKVRLANLTLAWNNMLNDMGKDNQGWFSSGLKGLTTVFKNWRELYRIISTVIVAIGAYKTASMVAGIAASRAVSSTIPAWFRLASIVRTTQGNIALLGLTMRSIPFTAWVTAIATLASYFILFNNSSDDVKQKLEDIKSAFDGVRKEVETLFADAIKTDNIGTQLTKLRDMLELAETELGVTIPIRLEDVNESNIKQKLKEAKQFVDEYINFSQTFSEAAAGTKFNELMNDFGSKARSTYTNVTESINSVVVALQELSDKGQASKRDIEILNELTSGQKDDESRIEYLQRLISLYEELGLIGQKKVTPKVSFFGSSEDNIEELEQQQENALDRLGIKNKSVFENMLKDVQGYYSSSSIAAYQFEQQVMRVAEKIDINNIPVEQRTMKLTAAINEEASQNNWNQFEKELARQIANEKFGTTIEISDESKKAAEEDLQAWQRNIKEWAKNNSITFDVSFQTNDTEASYAKRMLQDAKDAKELWETLGRKEKQGTGSKDATTKAYNDYLERRKLAAAAGADLSSLDAKSRKAASKAESELAKALKDELSTIDKVRSIYKDLTKEGMSHANAVERATRGWDETVNAINRVLQKNGLQKLDLSKFAGIENPRELVNMLQSQLNTLLKRGAKPAEIKELQTKIQTLNVDAEKYDLTKITKGLNNELGKLKDEYELAVELDANPELGSIFADYMGIDLNELPKNAEEAAKKAQQYIDKILRENKSKEKIDIASLMGKDAFDEWIKSSGHSMEDDLVKVVDNYRQALHKMQVDESKKQMQEWEKLLEKYAEYEYKVTQIQKEAEREREIARKKGASQEIIDAITERERQELAKLSFEEFQKTPEWIVATGDLANMSKSAIGMLIEQLEKYKRSAKNLSPKQIKQLNSALSKLYKEQRKNNPFKAISNMLDEAKERMATFDEDIEKTQKEIDNLTKKKKENVIDGIVDEETDNKLKKAIKRLQELKKNQEEVGKVSVSDWVASINETVEAVKAAVGVFDDLAKAIGGVENSDIDKVFSILEKGGQGAAVGAQIGDGWGALIGGVAGAAAGVITTFADQWSGNAGITEKVNSSERAVRRLELAFVDLQQAVEESYGTAVIGTKQATLANKELQLAEIQRQIELEKSRKSKNRDEDKIIELQTQYKELYYEIKNGYTELVDDLMGTDVSSFAENLVSSMIDAFKKGEDYMEIFNDKFDEMIDNMIMKSIVSRVVSQYLDQIWESVDEHINDRSKAERDEYAKAQNNLSRISQMNDEEIATEIARSMPGGGGIFGYFNNLVNVTQQDIEDYKKAAADEEQAAKKRLDAATAFAGSDIDYIMGEMNKVMPELGEKLKDILGEYYKFGESSETQLSALQQGLQSMSEDTGSALESYMNGVSQQVYLHSDLLTQIRDAVVGFDMDVQLGVFSQMLLQLQNNHIVMQSMQSMMENWTVPSGTGIRVELMS